MIISKVSIAAGIAAAIGCVIANSALKFKGDCDFHNLHGKELYTVTTKAVSDEGIPMIHVIKDEK